MEIINECCRVLSHSTRFDERCQAYHKLIKCNCKPITTGNLEEIIVCIIGHIPVPINEYGEADKLEKKFFDCCEEGKLASEASIHILSSVAHCDERKRENIFEVCIVPAIKLCATFRVSINTWSSQLVEKKVDELLTRIISCKNLKTVEQVFADTEIFSMVLKSILPDLTRDRWKKSEQSRSTYIYMVKRSNGDILTEYFGHLFPFMLMMVDDYVNSHVVSGLTCLQHILNEVPYSELRFLGRSDVIYDALMKKLYTREPIVANLLLPCLLSCLECIETKMMRMRGCELTKHDECLDIIMRNCHLSDNVAMKRLGHPRILLEEI